MNYNENVAYAEPFLQYDGVKVVSPESLGLNTVFNDAKVLAVFLLQPQSINSTIVFVDSSKVVIDESIEIYSTSSSLSVETINEQPYSYIAFSVEKDDVFATTEVEKVYASASTVTIEY